MPSSINPFQPSFVFQIETSHLFCRAKQMTGFYMKRNTGLKWIKQTSFENQLVNIILQFPQVNYK